MSEQEYFKKALSNFTYEAASGGAIRHMADLGYSVKRIKEQLDFPTSYERVQKTVWEHLQHTSILLLEEPGSGRQLERTTFVKEYDKYGKPSFRRVALSDKEDPICWKEEQFREGIDGNFISFLEKKCEQNGDGLSYVSCDFGVRNRSDSALFLKAIDILDDDQKEYILGISWEKKVFYHKINRDIIQVIARLYEVGQYEGICYFMQLGEKVRIARKNIKEYK